MLQPGQTVKFIEVLEPGDETLRFTVIELRGDRVLVELQDSGMSLVPQFVYSLSMLCPN